MVPEFMRVQREGAQLQPRGMWSAGQGDDKERFLADLRALRGTAALGHDELAARAHYPSDILMEAENGPALPGLPILAAYVRACDGDVPAWEERWRGLGYEVHADPGLPVRPAGASPAAVAGARAGISISPPDVHDPERIRAALRGQHEQADQAAQVTALQETAATGFGRADSAAEGLRTQGLKAEEGSGWGEPAHTDAGPGTEIAAGWGTNQDAGAGRDGGAAWTAGTNWDSSPRWETGAAWDTAARPGGAAANGSHHAGQQAAGLFDPAGTGTPGRGESAEAVRHEPFSSWLQDNELISPPDSGSGRLGRAESEPPPVPRDTRPTSPDPADSERTWRPAEPGLTSQDRADSERTWRLPDGGLAPPEPGNRGPARREEGGLAPSGATDFWTPAAAAPTDVHRAAPELPRRGIPDLPQGSGYAAAGQTQLPTEPAVPQNAAAARSDTRRDRLYPLRLVAVIVVAALIGSILVMLIR